ncbi:MAG: hypothetical protein JXR21_04725 [Candidatus Marinimicrobia bacterium]|nr:hypothetical protein [Candidatus Neomarinimicrobiota bacterium]
MKKIVLLAVIFLSFLTVAAQDISVFVTGNNRGSLVPCGCVVPGGGWARIGAVLEKADAAAVRVAAGNHFFSHVPTPGDDQILDQNKALLQAALFSEYHFDVINVGEYDLCYGLRFLQNAASARDLPFVSANVRDADGYAPFPPYCIVSRKGIDLAFIGISEAQNGFNYSVVDPVPVLKQLLHGGITEEADFIMLLADSPPSRTLTEFLKSTPGIDLVVCARDPLTTEVPLHYGTTALVQLGSQGKYLGILDLEYGAKKANWMDISPYDRVVRKAEKSLPYAEDRKAAEKQLKKQRRNLLNLSKKHPDRYLWKMLFLDGNIMDDPAIKARVTKYETYPGE